MVEEPDKFSQDAGNEDPNAASKPNSLVAFPALPVTLRVVAAKKK